MGKAIPYGVYDFGADEGWVSVGNDADTAAFAVPPSDGGGPRWDGTATIRRPTSICATPGAPTVTASGPGRSAGQAGQRNRTRTDRLPFSARNLEVEQDRASHVQLHHHELEGRPLTSYRVVVQLIANTTTKKGLKVNAELDEGYYPTGIKITNKEPPPSHSPAMSFTVTGTTTCTPTAQVILCGPLADILRDLIHVQIWGIY